MRLTSSRNRAAVCRARVAPIRPSAAHEQKQQHSSAPAIALDADGADTTATPARRDPQAEPGSVGLLNQRPRSSAIASAEP